jgi:two-component system chemotaxis sensor kinase CheA
VDAEPATDQIALEAVPPASLKPDDRPAEDGASKRIIVIDDRVEILDVFKACLEVAGYQVATTGRGAEAGHSIKEIRPDLAIIDLLMPDLPGWAVLDAIRGNPETATLPVIVCSAAAAELRAREARLRAVGCEILPKPFDLEDLFATVARMLGQPVEAG